ncbi:MAG: hypothetical protein RLZZ292_505 [Bacteroidota bacterium]|jgi:acetyltransferase-like isoleucine patch superfamily enzyme
MIEKGFFLKHPPHKGLIFGNDVYVGFNTTLDIPFTGTIIIENNVAFTGFSYVSCAVKVHVGENTLIGEFVSIRDANHGINANQLIINQPMEATPILIGSNCWIARGVAIVRGGSIGNNSVIGANALVNTHIKENSIAVGTPAKVIKQR